MARRISEFVLFAHGDGESGHEVCALMGQIGLDVVSVKTGGEALAVAERDLPSVVAIDVELAEPSGYEVCREMRDRFGEMLPIVFIAGTRTAPVDEIAGLLLGADDYFTKPLQADRFVARIRRLVARASASVAGPPLTTREREVLKLLMDGRRPREIAELLCITRKTVGTHIEHVLAKLGAHSQAQAVAFAMRDRTLLSSARTDHTAEARAL